MGRIIIAADIGTTNVKCVAAGEDLRLLATASSEYDTYNTGVNCYEHNPDDWYDHFKIAMSKAIKIARAKPQDVVSIAISAQAPTFLPVDEDGKPLHRALIWMDRRAEEQCDYMRNRIGGDNVYGITGNIVDPYFVLPKILWFRDNHPELYKKTRHFMQVNGYVNFRLTGEYSIDDAHASLTLAYDAKKGDWSRDILNALDVDPALFPKVYGVSDVIGAVSKSACNETGIPEGTPVYAGCPDAAAAMVEAGCTPGDVAVEMTGTSSVLMVMSRELATSRKLVYMRSAHEGLHTLLGCISCAGASLKWFRDTLYRQTGDIKTAYQRMNEEIASEAANPTRLLFLPYLAGERSPIWDSDARGCIYGMTLGTSRAEMIRAIFEGSAMALYDNFLATVEAGAKIRSLRAVGGAASSEIWLKIKASTLDMPIEVPETNLGAPGGMLAISAKALGLFPSIESAADSLLKIDRVIEPNRDWTDIYREKYALYKKLYLNTRELNRAL